MSKSDTEVEKAWQIGCEAIIPEKSRNRYEKVYKMFKIWCEEKNGASINEKVLLAYFVRRNETLKSPGSLWAEYSMLKSAIDISTFHTLIAYLKRKNVGHRSKKAAVFTKKQIKSFLNELPITGRELMLGIAGACRGEELYNMTIDNIEDHQEYIIIKLPNMKNNVQRTFTLTNKVYEEIHYLEIFKKYISLRPPRAKYKNLFLNYRNAKCTGSRKWDDWKLVNKNC